MTSQTYGTPQLAADFSRILAIIPTTLSPCLRGHRNGDLMLDKFGADVIYLLSGH